MRGSSVWFPAKDGSRTRFAWDFAGRLTDDEVRQIKEALEGLGASEFQVRHQNHLDFYVDTSKIFTVEQVARGYDLKTYHS